MLKNRILHIEYYIKSIQGLNLISARTLLLSIILFLLAIPVVAQDNTADAPANSQSLTLKVSTLEQSYDSQVYSLLANYFDRKKFFVDVAIDAEFVDETVETTVNQVRTNQGFQQPVAMPGLPFLPQENLRQPITDLNQTPETVVNQSTIRSLRLNSVTINIYADTSYTNEEIQFMRLLTGIASKIDENRGDIIAISQIPIPDFSDNDPIQVIQNEPTNLSLFASFREYVPLFILALLVGGILILNTVFSKPKDGLSPVQQREVVKHDFNFTGNPGMGGGGTWQGVIQGQEAEKRALSLEVDDLIDNFFTNPKEVALLFEYWVEEDGDEGVLKSAELLKSVDPHLIRTIKGEIQAENYKAIKEKAESLEPIISQRKDEIIRNFNSMLKGGPDDKGSAKKKGHMTLFKFLEHVSDNVILQLVSEEGYQTGALILEYLSDDRAAKILDRLDRNRSTNIMLKMASIDDVPYKLQSEISSRMFDQAMDLKEREKEQRYGAENILSVLDKLPLDQQQDYIDQLKTSNVVVGEIVEKEFVTINQIPTITDDVIKEALNDMDTTKLIKAVAGLETKYVDKILSVRPTREQKLIRMELDEMNGSAAKNTTEAKSEMMASIRKTLKKAKDEV